MIGTNIRYNLMEMMIANIENACTINAVIHCLNFSPSSSGITPMIGGAITYKNSILKILVIAVRMISPMLYIRTIDNP